MEEGRRERGGRVREKREGREKGGEGREKRGGERERGEEGWRDCVGARSEI